MKNLKNRLQNSLNKGRGVKKIKQTAEHYRANIKVLRKKLFLALKKYKEAMDMERVAVAKKRNK